MRERAAGREDAGQNGKDDWPRVRREARILSESNYRAGRAVVINQIPRRNDATKTNRPRGQGNPLVKHACLACIIFGWRGVRKSLRALRAEGVLHIYGDLLRSHSRYSRIRSALAPTWRARSSDLAPYPTNCVVSLSLSPPFPSLFLPSFLSLYP